MDIFNTRRTRAQAAVFCDDKASAASGLALTSLIVSVLLTVLIGAGWMSLI